VILHQPYIGIVNKFIQRIRDDAETVPAVMKIIWVVRSLERLGDRCQNIKVLRLPRQNDYLD